MQYIIICRAIFKKWKTFYIHDEIEFLRLPLDKITFYVTLKFMKLLDFRCGNKIISILKKFVVKIASISLQTSFFMFIFRWVSMLNNKTMSKI
jgi:hypothetical protein